MANLVLVFNDENQYQVALSHFDSRSDFYPSDISNDFQRIAFKEDNDVEALERAIDAELTEYGITGYWFEHQGEEEKVIIEANREGYGFDQIRNTMTVRELIDYLEQFNEDAKVYLSHDNGYTYGGITERCFK